MSKKMLKKLFLISIFIFTASAALCMENMQNQRAPEPSSPSETRSCRDAEIANLRSQVNEDFANLSNRRERLTQELDSIQEAKLTRFLVNKLNRLINRHIVAPRSWGEPIEISLDAWVSRMFVSRCPPEVFFCAIIYLERLKEKYANIELSDYNIRRLFLTACIVADKFVEDRHLRQEDWKLIAYNKFSLTFIHNMEIEFCKLLDWNFLVSCEEIQENMQGRIFFNVG